MKIGIITFHCAYNYGAVLQAYALQEYLKSLDNEVHFLNYKPSSIVNFYSFFGSAKKEKKTLKKILCYLTSLFHIFEKIKRNKAFSSFTKSFNLDQDFLFSNYDLLICGGDQIWNPIITKGIDKNYFGQFFEGKKISYAASDGDCLVYSNEVKKLLKTFDSISVREKQMIKKIQSILPNMKIQKVCDPVFLLNKEQWEKIAILPNEKNYILLYKVGQNENIDSEIKEFAKLRNKKIIELCYVKSIKKFFIINKNLKKKYCVSPQEFLGYFVKADYIFTTSFHATALSIIFKKKFFAYEIQTGAQRIIDLLEVVELKDRYVCSYKNYSKKIDIKENNNLERYILTSKKFLERCL